MSHTGGRKRHILLIILIVLVLLSGLAVGAVYAAMTYFKITAITFEGTDKYTEEELPGIYLEITVR